MFHYYDLASTQNAVQVLELLLELEMGSKQTNRPFFDKMGTELNCQVEDLCSLLFIVVLNFELVSDRVESPELQSNNTEALFHRPDLIESINKSIWDCLESARPYQDLTAMGVVAIGWACYAQFLMMVLTRHCPNEYKELVAVLGSNHPIARSPQRLFQYGYQQARAIDYLERIVSKSSFIQLDPNQLAYKAIIKGLLNILLTTQNISTLPEKSKLVRVYSNLFTNSPALCSRYWTKDFHTSCGNSLLESSLRAFPLNFSDFASMINALVSGPDSADYGFQYLCSLPTFCCSSSSNFELSFEQKQGLTIWHWRGSNVVRGSVNFVMCPENGSIAYDVGNNLVLLKYQYSAWHLFLSYLDSFLCSSSIDEEAQGTVETATCIIRLFNRMLKYGDEETHGLWFSHLAEADGNYSAYAESRMDILPGIVGEILSHCSHSKIPALELITECLETFDLLLPHFPSVSWKRLQASTFFPQYSYSASFVQNVVLPLECSQGLYSTTIAYLFLVKRLIFEVQKREVASRAEGDLACSGMIYNSLVFILRDIFPTCSSWRFVHIYEKFQVNLVIMQILNCIMDDTSWYHFERERTGDDGEVRLSHAYKLVLDAFVFQANNYQLAPILDVIALGNNGPLSYYASGKKKEAQCLEDCMIEALKLLKNFLLILTQDHNPSVLESALLDRTILTSSGPVEFIQIIASFIGYQNNHLFAQYATENLTLLCLLSKRPGRSTTSFVGYFGAEAFTLVSQFIDLVRSKGRVVVSGSIQTAIYSFITAVIDSQPGLVSFFLTGAEPKSMISKMPEAKDAIPEKSILMPILSVMKEWKKMRIDNPSVLHACCTLLDTLWHCAREHQATIKLLRNQGDLWISLIEILTEKVDKADSVTSENCSSYCFFLSAQAHVIRILSMEAFLNFAELTADRYSLTLKKIEQTLINCLCTRSPPVGQELLVHHPVKTKQLLHLSKNMDRSIAFEGYRRINWDEEIDSGKKYGIDFIYNLPLMKRKLCHLDGYLDIHRQVQEVNCDWSLTDVQMVLLRASSFAVKTLLRQPSGSLTLDHTEKLMDTILKNLLCQNTPEFIHIIYKTELATLLVHLVNFWSKQKTGQQKGMALLSEFHSALMIQYFPIGPIGSFSSFPFHFQILTGMLILISSVTKISNKTPDFKGKFDLLCQSILPTLCHGLCSIFSGTSSPESADEEVIILSILMEITHSTGASTSVWLPFFEKYQIPSLLMHAFSTWQPNLNTNICSSPDNVLRLLLSMARYASSAQLLASNGIVASFCNNHFATDFVEGQVTPYDGVDVKQNHQVWCLVISILSELAIFLRGDNHFLESIVGCLRLFHEQIFSALFSKRQLTLAGLKEIELITGLYCRIAESLEMRRSRLSSRQAEDMSEVALLNEFQEYSLPMLGNFTSLFKNPGDRKKRILPLSRQERHNSDLSIKQGVSNLLAGSDSIFSGQRDYKLLLIIQNLLSFLRIYSQSALILSYTNTEAEFPILLVKSINCSDRYHDTSATFGDLFELMRDLTQQLKKEHDVGSSEYPNAVVRNLVFTWESTLTLVASQLKLFMSDENAMNDKAVGEILNEFDSAISDLRQLVQEASSKWSTTPFIKEAYEFSDLLKSPLNLVQP
jgi:hypothetical protein